MRESFCWTLSRLFFLTVPLAAKIYLIETKDGTVRAAAPASPRSRPQAGSLLYQTQDGHTRLLTAGQGQAVPMSRHRNHHHYSEHALPAVAAAPSDISSYGSDYADEAPAAAGWKEKNGTADAGSGKGVASPKSEFTVPLIFHQPPIVDAAPGAPVAPGASNNTSPVGPLGGQNATGAPGSPGATNGTSAPGALGGSNATGSPGSPAAANGTSAPGALGGQNATGSPDSPGVANSTSAPGAPAGQNTTGSPVSVGATNSTGAPGSPGAQNATGASGASNATSAPAASNGTSAPGAPEAVGAANVTGAPGASATPAASADGKGKDNGTAPAGGKVKDGKAPGSDYADDESPSEEHKVGPAEGKVSIESDSEADSAGEKGKDKEASGSDYTGLRSVPVKTGNIQQEG